MKRIGILTSGGDCAGLNAAMRSIFYRAKKYGMEVKSLYLGKTGSGFSSWIDVTHLDGRNTTKFDGNCHVHNIAIITKISNERLSLITHSPNQYSYEEVDWK